MVAKYFSIAEVSDMLSISKSNLRYLESNLKNLKVKKIRGRRYYSESNIKRLQSELEARGTKTQLDLFHSNQNSLSNTGSMNMISQIEALEAKFMSLQRKLT